MANVIRDLGVEGVEDRFAYLDNLRDSGATNMFGAAPYLAEEFEMSIRDARIILGAWQHTFSKTVPAADRADTAFEAAA